MSKVFAIGKKVFIRTVTMAQVGEIKDVEGSFVCLGTASWVADTGRFHDALLKGDFSEVEPFVGDVWVNTEAIIDMAEWKHELPTKQK
jgi:hypothetical protein